MGDNARGPAGQGRASDDNDDDAPDGTPLDPPPPCVLDLGNGEVMCAGTADDFSAAAEWLRRNYPDGTQGERAGPVSGPVLNMGYQLTREARAGMPRGWSMGQRAVVLVLADICNDRTRRPPSHMDVSPQLLEELDIGAGTLRNILSSLAAAGFEFRVAVGKDKRGLPVFAHKGHAVDYQFPELPSRDVKGPLNDGPLGASEPVDNPSDTASEGASASAPSDSKAHPRVHLQGPKAHPSMLKGASASAPLTTVTPSSKEDALRVGDPIADKLSQDQGQDPSNPNANSQNRRVHIGPETVAGEAQEIPLHDSESATDGYRCARASDPPVIGRSEHAESPGQEPGGASAPLSEPANPAGSDATRSPNERQPGESTEDYRRRMQDALMAMALEHQAEAAP